MFAYIQQFKILHEDDLLVHCIVHLLTQRRLPDTSELTILTIDNEKIRLFLISEQANYLDKNQQSVIEHLATNTGLTQELFEHMKTFFLSVAKQFDQK
jgi:hypothetical protein